MIRGRLERHGDDAWFDPSSTPKAATSALLLPNYDEYFIGYKDRSAIGKRVNGIAAVTGGTADLTHVALIDGELVGGWRRLAEKGEVILAMEFWTDMSDAEHAKIGRVVKALGKFLDVRVTARGPRRNGGTT